ncbi:hypothetical protein NO989_17805 [Alteromonas sp. DY56-G5]|uniref:hypothetical protein n=1 Tax=Alteromonas TaxID=226 RepID=UPI000403C256|nr:MULTISPECIES: hypothetical protein [Alteromonas]MBC6985536.1 hypothetical protein [Alteromonas sp. BZK5]MCG7640810.1 hypothetical protein [Alteromonas sp. MmMcT2-2]MEC8964120.1 hypothetical protein [Pseudomonadota bacterium]QPL48958.1 hypothetical protein IUA53_13875 [Alteromonas sp. B31-7]
MRSDSYNRHPNITHGRSRAYSGLGWRITVADGLAPLLRNRENAQQKVGIFAFDAIRNHSSEK